MSTSKSTTNIDFDKSHEKDDLLVSSLERLRDTDLNVERLTIVNNLDQASFGPSPDLLVGKVKQITAEIDVIQNAPVTVLPDSKIIKYECLQDELEKSISELSDTLTFINSENQELQIESEQEEELQHQLNDLVVESLTQRLNEHDFETNDAAGAKEKLKREISEKRIKANAYFKQVLKDSSQFCNKYFSLPSEQDFNEQQKKLRSADKTITVQNMLCLKDVISELMNKCFDEPNQPYIVLDRRYWPPYVELLLRCQIVVRHPDDPRRIKLIPFHL